GFVPDSVINQQVHSPPCSTPRATTSTPTTTTTAPPVAFQAHRFTVQLPPGNWVLEHQEQARTGYVDTRWHLAGNPNIIFVVDYTPGFSGAPVTAAEGVRKLFVSEPGYQQLSF